MFVELLISVYFCTHLLFIGGMDFSIVIWNLLSGQLIRRFVNHAGQVERLFIPPETCCPRVKVCSNNTNVAFFMPHPLSGEFLLQMNFSGMHFPRD